MVSFLNANLPVLMQLNRAEGGTFLPWPNGTLLSGRLAPASEGSGVMLMLGNYRIRIEVPPNTAMGKVWLQLLQREMPGQFHLLSDKQAISLIVELLQKNSNKPEISKSLSQHQSQTSPTSASQEWAKLNLNLLPFHAESYAERLMLYDEKDGQAQGLLQKSVSAQGFMLHGRLDLEKLGSVAFSLEEKKGSPWMVHVYVMQHDAKVALEQFFLDWLHVKKTQTKQSLEGHVFESMPQHLGRQLTRKG